MSSANEGGVTGPVLEAFGVEVEAGARLDASVDPRSGADGAGKVLSPRSVKPQWAERIKARDACRRQDKGVEEVGRARASGGGDTSSRRA